MLLLFLLVVIVAIGGALVNFCYPNHPSDTNRSCKTNTVKAAWGKAWSLYWCSIMKETLDERCIWCSHTSTSIYLPMESHGGRASGWTRPLPSAGKRLQGTRMDVRGTSVHSPVCQGKGILLALNSPKSGRAQVSARELQISINKKNVNCGIC